MPDTKSFTTPEVTLLMNNLPDFSEPAYYEICINGLLSPEYATWFEDMTVTSDKDTTPPKTIIRGFIRDQAALYGLIDRARDLGLNLLSVRRIDGEEEIKQQALKGEAYDNMEDSQSAEGD